MYLDEEGLIKPVEDLNEVSHVTPVHLILGAVSDFMFVPLFLLLWRTDALFADHALSSRL